MDLIRTINRLEVGTILSAFFSRTGCLSSPTQDVWRQTLEQKQEASEVPWWFTDFHLLLPLPCVRLSDGAEENAGGAFADKAPDHSQLHSRDSKAEKSSGKNKPHCWEKRRHCAKGNCDLEISFKDNVISDDLGRPRPVPLYFLLRLPDAHILQSRRDRRYSMMKYLKV